MVARGLANRIRFRAVPALSFFARRANAAERVLADDRTGRLVVDVEVARRIPYGVARLGHGGLVGGEHRAGQAVGRALIDQAQRLGQLRWS